MVLVFVTTTLLKVSSSKLGDCNTSPVRWVRIHLPRCHRRHVPKAKSTSNDLVSAKPETGGLQNCRANGVWRLREIWRSMFFPCSKLKVPVQNVLVWKHRALFIRLLKQVVAGIEIIRAYDCHAPGQYYYYPNITFVWTDIKRRIERERVSTAALNFLHGIAFANSFCV